MRILVAGIGNIFLGDDGFGSEVARLLAVGPDDAGVRIVDYGIAGMHLAYDLLDDWDALVIVDALPNRGNPGGLHVFEVDHESHSTTAALDGHSMDPAAVFASLGTLGGTPPYTVIIGCEAANLDDRIGLSTAVAAAVPKAIEAVAEVVAGLRARSPVAPGERRC